ncbi:ABC transporter substrate-binding protein [Desulfopila aestuarii]|nr:ABC transporter substrate-binding protein [Desulfopila aestuarii]
MARATTGAIAETTSIRLQLRWLHQFQFAGYYAAIKEGYYSESGLQVTLIEGGKGKDTIDEVLNGNADYGVTNAEMLLQRLNGKPLVAVAAIFQHSPLIFVARKSSGITVPQDLSGKIVKMSRTSRDIELQAMLHGEGVNFDKLILLEDVASYNDYFDPNIDVLAAYITNQPYYLKEKHIPYTIISPSSYGIDFYGDCLFTTENEAKTNPARVQAFREATVKGWHYALAHKEEIIDLILNTYQSKKSREHLRYEADEIEKLILADLVEIGHMNPGRWEHIAKTFHQYQLIPDNYSLDGFIFSAEQDKLPHWIYRALMILGAATILITLGCIGLFFFNRRLQSEIAIRKKTEMALHQSEKSLLNYSKQIEQFSISAASILSIRDEKALFAEMSKAIIELSDFSRVLILLFKDEPPFREFIGSAGISDEVLAKIRMTHLPQSWYDDIFELGIKLGQMSYYVPHNMKSILNQEAVFYGEGSIPDREDMWHPQDNLFVRMNNEKGELIGVISVDTSKSGARPTDETVRPLEVYAGLISQIIVLKREHIRRQQLEQKLRFSQKLEALGNLTGGIAHDFNNILGIIIGNAELALLDTTESHPTYHNLSEIRNACNRARDIVQHLLMFNRKSDKELRPIAVADLLKDSLRFLRTIIPPNIELINQIQTIDEHLLADPPQIYQALLNLFTNGVQAMEDTGGTLTIASRTELLREPLKCSTGEIPPGRYIRLSVSDTGHGIAPHLIEKIFDPYYTTREFGKGTGMGLSIVHGIIQSHNGAILVQSFVGQGTTFILYLPVIEKIVDEKQVTSPPMLPGGSENILLVDDDEALLEVGMLMLQKLGYSVITYIDPEQALEYFRQHTDHIQLLITDMTMPVMSGRELAEKALELKPDLPVFLCTGYSDKIDEREATRIGISRYFEKPLDPVIFSAAIRNVLSDRPHS